MTSAFKYEYQSDFARKYVAQGRDEGRAEGRAEEAARLLLMALDARGITIADHVRVKIAGCMNIDQLESWIRKAATAESEDEAFG
ncbi:hypothetical protein IU459_02770 [Nocardia amamiensis]|uniref:Transposase n=1 Tax=Nocardia amamiensis TaxID=404578 RepID=A0ABS0CKY6_9NOCA|nr:hypothetical protein [Nocardia amamiensis]MBF6296462.1 hypothetical protein [Nocardia amamiensis]